MTGAGNSTVINSGLISGGFNAAGIVRSNAIEFSNGGNVLEIRSNSVIEGTTIAARSSEDMKVDTFSLGGDADASFDTSQFGVQYIGFNQME